MQLARRRLGVLVALVASLSITLLSVGAGTAPGALDDWRARLAQAAALGPPADSSTQMKDSLAAALNPVAAGRVTKALLARVVSDDATRYADGVRPRTLEDARAMFDKARTDEILAGGLTELLNGTSAAAPSETRLQAAIDLLRADRASALATVADATAVAKTTKDAEDLANARKQLAEAAAAWRDGKPQQVVTNYCEALRFAWSVLTRNGVSYAPSADRDGDGLADLIELRIGSSPLKADTDGDTLTDGFEFSRASPFHLATKFDTDGDAMSDAIADVDGDGLTAFREQELGTDPLQPDTDGEGLDDARETQLGTSPLKADTDGDGLDDAAELRSGTDPLRADSDGDGIPDGQDVVTGVVTTAGVQVALTGHGDLADALTVHDLANEPSYANAPGQVGTAFDFDLEDAVEGQLETAKLTLPYPASFSGDPNDLQLFTLDPEKQFWLPVGGTQTVDQAAHTVTATVGHFSIYAVFDIRNWRQRWTAIGGTCKPRGGTGEVVNIDLVLTIDSSGSMTTNDPSGLRRTAAKSFVDALLAQDRSAVVDFDSGAALLQALTTNKVAVKAAIDRIDSSGGTDIGAGVQVALNELATVADPARAKLIVLLTDGEGSYTHTLTERASREQVTIFTIGLGSSVDAVLLREIATRTGGQYYPVANASDLPDVFRELEHDTGDSGQDTDGDGLTDCQETEGMRDPGGLVFTSDPRLVDTDGDGLTDHEEVGRGLRLDELPVIGGLFPAGTVYFDVFSDPHAVDSEGDGLTDLEDLAAGARARSNETDGDGLGDWEEVQAGTDPAKIDTDGDELSDGFEVMNEDHGFDPLAEDETYSGFEYAREFGLGLSCFEIFGGLFGICNHDNIPYLMGDIARGFFGVTDIIDAVGSLVHGDLYGAGFYALAVVPFVGDGLKFVDEVVAFAKKGGPVARTTIAVVMRMGKVSNGVKLDLLRHVYGESFDTLRVLGATDDGLLRMARKRVDLHVMADAARGAASATRAPRWFTPGDAEDYMRGLDAGNLNRGFRMHRDPAAVGAQGSRVQDVWNPTTRSAKEVKVGYQDGSRVLDEADYDADLLALGRIADTEWHFLPNADGVVGMSQRLLDRLRANGIPYHIHLP